MTVRKIFVVSGVRDAGKTSTLNILAQELLRKPDAKNVLGTSVSSQGQEGQYVIDIPTIGRIGIYTMGDDADAIKKAFEFFKVNGCETVCLASRHEAGHKSVKALTNKAFSMGVTPLFLELMYLDEKECTKSQTLIVDAIIKLIAC